MGYRQKLAELMRQHEWEQRDLALSSGLTPVKIQRFFRRTDLDVPDLERVARAFGLKAGDLLDRSEKDQVLERLAPIVTQLAAVPLGQQERIVEALSPTLSTILSVR